jgi:hypothetical protein
LALDGTSAVRLSLVVDGGRRVHAHADREAAQLEPIEVGASCGFLLDLRTRFPANAQIVGSALQLVRRLRRSRRGEGRFGGPGRRACRYSLFATTCMV